MRRLLVATLLGAALSTPAFAADADDVPTPALTISPATRDEAEKLMRTYVRRILERDLKSVAFLEEISNP